MTDAQNTGAEPAKGSVRAFVDQAVSAATLNDVPLTELQGIALFNSMRDARLTSLDTYDGATQDIASTPGFTERFGIEASPRIVLQFAYQYFARIDSVRYDEATFEGLWLVFLEEVQEPNWTFRAVGNLRNFASETLLIDLGDGVTIRGRSPEDLRSLGFDTPVWNRIADDWSGFGASSFVLVTEHSVPKLPDNLISVDSYALSVKAMRTMQALRLTAEGAVGVGPMWVICANHFNVGIGGVTSVGTSIPMIGGQYRWTATVDHSFRATYSDLARLDENKWYGRSPGNLEIAIRAFMATYDSWPRWPEWQLLNCITALEALLGTETEIAFKLSFRVASLLGTNDNERSNFLSLMREFYDTRSRLVHGGELKTKHRERLQRLDDLISIVRRLVKSFVGFAAAPPADYKKLFVQLDNKLVDANEREKLRAILDLR
jgi:hypothetical protein